MNLSQPAVTRRIRKLETALDSLLFERTTRAVRPTLAAKRLQTRAEAILEDARETARAMRDDSVAFAHQRNALVTIATIPTVVRRLITPALSKFESEGSKTRVRLIEGSANVVAEAVAGGEADFGLCSVPALEPSTEFEPLFDDRIVLALPAGHPAAGCDPKRWDTLKGIPLILPARGTGNRLLIDEAMAKARVPSNWTFEVGRTATALELVETGVGAALVPESATDGAGVATCALADMEIARPVGILTRLGQTDTQPVTALKCAIRVSV